MNDQRYRFSVGISVTKQEAERFADYGLMYDNLPYDDLVMLEEIASRHMVQILDGMKPMIDELVAKGYAEAEKRR